LRHELRAAEEQQQDDNALEYLDRQLAALDAKIEKETEQMLLLPPDLVADGAATVRKWKAEREQLQ
jgi:hypothetical protein